MYLLYCYETDQECEEIADRMEEYAPTDLFPWLYEKIEMAEHYGYSYLSYAHCLYLPTKDAYHQAAIYEINPNSTNRPTLIKKLFDPSEIEDMEEDGIGDAEELPQDTGGIISSQLSPS